MEVRERPALRAFNTFAVDSRAELMVVLETEEDLLSAPSFDPNTDILLGEGSNVLLVGDVPGTVFLNRIRGINIVRRDRDHALVEAGAGENWHALVRWSLEQGYSGLENLSLIPGSVGAAPIQNIGAYGVELESVLDRVTAWDWRAARWVTFNREQCALGYRESRFKNEERDRYLITSVRLRLDCAFTPQLGYGGLMQELGESHAPTALDVSDAVIRLRRSKLPDPAVTGNAGSFFKNPVVDKATGEALHTRFPGLPAWPAEGGRVKLSAAWMIEHCGLKGYRCGAAAVSSHHALVLVNNGGASGFELLRLADKVQRSVSETFGIQLDPEPRILDFN